ncbi:hypothetical protein L211DRAFT_147757 [Terfezia boudieri ATCC MYA-4762]|uniref:Transmembrane protein n=1 Tax=Terfezia boudieri ATCC MYA-4762 TaxID=1051890 RepID=A0A3N4LPK0_9PEZI|nr:hypothetical protein L211DRAFT_147757 [Terfezia boudieri ATCC MYA-4762]
MGKRAILGVSNNFLVFIVLHSYILWDFFSLPYLFSFIFLRRLSNCIAFDPGFWVVWKRAWLILEAVGDGAFWLEIRFLSCSVCACLAWVEVSLGGRVKGTTGFHLLLLRVFSFISFCLFSVNVILITYQSYFFRFS